MIVLLSLLVQAGEIEGRVLERGTSRPLEDGVVTWSFELPDGRREQGGTRVAADGAPARPLVDGRFVVPDVPDGTVVHLRVSTENHRLQELEVTAPTSDLKVFLEPLPADLEVVVESFQDTPHPTVHRVDAEQAYETPGTQDDVVRLTQALPGVTVQREFSPTSGDLSVRGSAPGDNRYYLDGIEIPYLYHFNQYASVFPTTQLRRLELYPSTFGARYGDAVGGVVEAKSRTDRPEDLEGQLTFNTIIAGADFRAPVGKKGWWLAAAGRRSYQDLYSRGSDQYTLWPIFHDLAVRAEKGDEDAGTGIFFVSAGDRYARAAGELDILDPLEAEESPSFEYRRAFQVAGVRHRWQGEEGGSGRLVAALVHDDLRGDLGTIGSQHQRAVTLASRLDWTRPVGPQREHLLGLGWEVRGGLNDIEVDGADDVGVLVTTEAPAIGRGVDTDVTIPRLEAALYGDLLLRFGDLQLIPGARVGVDSLTGKVLPEPRAAVRWRLADQTSLELAGGYYLQTPSVIDLADGVGNPDLPLTRSWQASAGIEQTIANRLELTLDAYAKHLTNAQLAIPDGPPEVYDRGRALGVELVTRYRLRETFFLWGWASVARTQVWRETGWASGPYDQPVNLGAVASWDPSAKWNLALRWRYGSGLPWTPVSGGIYDANDDSWSPVQEQPWSARLPAYTKVDLAAARRFTFDRWSLTLRAEVWYVPKRANVLYPTWNDDWSEQGFVRGIPLLPLLGARATF